MPGKGDHHDEVPRVLRWVDRSAEGALDLLGQLHTRGEVQAHGARRMDRHEEENNQQIGEETPAG